MRQQRHHQHSSLSSNSLLKLLHQRQRINSRLRQRNSLSQLLDPSDLAWQILREGD